MSRATPARLRGLAAAALAVACARVIAGCSLGNVTQDDCTGDASCVAAFGLGSTCEDGYCTDAPKCAANADCRDALGPATVCDDGVCARITLDGRCTIAEPESLLDSLRAGTSVGDTILLGVILRDDGGAQSARTAAIRLAVREMNEAGGIQGRSLGAVVCNNEGSDTDATLIESLVVHLGDEIGTPVIIGPAGTSDVITATNAVLARKVPIAVIAPSATGVGLTGQPDRLNTSDPVGLLWRTAPSDALQAKVMAGVVADTLGDAGTVTLSVVFQDDAYGQGLERALRDALADLAPDVTVRSEGFSTTDLEGTVPEAVGRAADAAPAGVVVLAGRGDRALAVLQSAADQGALRTLPFFLSDGAKDASVLLTGEDVGVTAILSSAVGTGPYNPDSGSFFDALRGDFGIEASQFGFVAHAYDAAYIAGLGLAHAARDGGHLDGIQVASGWARLSDGGTESKLGPSSFSAGVAQLLTEDGTVNIGGESGPLDFDASTGEAPGFIETWRVNADGDAFERIGEPEIPD